MGTPFYDSAGHCRFFPKPDLYPALSLPPDCGWYPLDFSGPYSPYLQFVHSGTPFLLGKSRAGNLVGFSMPTTADQRAEICISRPPHEQQLTAFSRVDWPEQRLSGYLAESERVAAARKTNGISGIFFSFEGR